MVSRELAQRVAAAEVARLATVDETGAPHIVPVVFALAGEHLFTAVDQKPKRTTQLRRLRNIAAQPRVSVLVDHYEPDWSRLWWVRLDGLARVVTDDAMIELLVDKYSQYRAKPPPGPVIDVTITRWTGWEGGTDGS